MRIRVALLLAVVLAWFPAPSRALDPDKAFHQQVRDAWSIEQGLPQITVTAIAQDRPGYLWVGTQSGVSRFDGVRFATFTPGAAQGPAGPMVRTVLAGRDGRLWIGSSRGLSVYAAGRFQPRPVADARRFPTLEIAALAEDARGTLWAATDHGLFRLDGDRLRHVAGSPVPATSLIARRDGLHVGTRGAVLRLDGSGWRRLPLPVDAAAVPVNALADVQGRVWVATGAGLFVLDAGAWRAPDGASPLAGMPLEFLLADRDGNLWTGGDLGLARLRGGRLAEYVPAGAPGGIRGLRIAFEDREGNLWFGSYWDGLVRVHDSWTRRFAAPEGLHEPVVWSVAPDPDGQGVWTGTLHGVELLRDGRFQLVAPGASLPHPAVYCLLAEPGRVWVGTRLGPAALVSDAPGGWRVEHPPELAPLRGLTIYGIARDGADRWFATGDGLYRLTGARLRRYAQAAGLADARIRYIERAPDGRLLVGSQDGLYVLRGDRFVRTGQDRGLPDGLDVTVIRAFDDGTIVLGATGEQLYVFGGGRWRALGDAQGMPTNTPVFVTAHAGWLWIAGIRGIERAPLADVRAFAGGRLPRVRGRMLLNERGDPFGGQKGYCCNGGGLSSGFLRGDTLWLASRDGVVAMDAHGIRANPVPPVATIERVRSEGRWRPAAALRGTTLPVDARDLSFEFTVLSLQAPLGIGLQYRLLGYDGAWQTADPANRSANYTNLPPGDYSFEVRGRNNAGVPTRAPARLDFSIKPRFHETRLFLALSALLLATTLYAGYRLQRRRYDRRQQALEAIVQQRTEAYEVANHRLEDASQTDPLTGLRNRRYLANQLPADLAHYDRERQRGTHRDEALLLALLDIDGFSTVDATHGRKAGDRVLRQLAHLLVGLVRSGDYVVRWNDDVFLLVLRPLHARDVATVGQRVLDAIRGHAFRVEEAASIRLSCSIGLAEYPLLHEPHARPGWEALVELADQARSYVKQHGGDGWAAFRPVGDTGLVRLLHELQHGADALIAQGRLRLIGTKPGPPRALHGPSVG